MSITDKLNLMRKQEILAELPKMNVTELMAKRTELKSLLYNRDPTRSQQDKQSISDITMTITRELNSRAEPSKEEVSKANLEIIKSAQAKRTESNIAHASKLHDRAKSDFDNMPYNQQRDFLDVGNKNPHTLEASDYVTGHPD